MACPKRLLAAGMLFYQVRFEGSVISLLAGYPAFLVAMAVIGIANYYLLRRTIK